MCLMLSRENTQHTIPKYMLKYIIYKKMHSQMSKDNNILCEVLVEFTDQNVNKRYVHTRAHTIFNKLKSILATVEVW